MVSEFRLRLSMKLEIFSLLTRSNHYFRLYKMIPPNTKTSKECDPDIGEFYKFTASVYLRKRSNYERTFMSCAMFLTDKKSRFRHRGNKEENLVRQNDSGQFQRLG